MCSVNTETLAVRISKAERDALRRRAKHEQVSQGDLVRRALRAYGVTTATSPDQTGYDVIKHLIGRAEGGPTDLSSNPAHLADYGK